FDLMSWNRFKDSALPPRSLDQNLAQFLKGIADLIRIRGTRAPKGDLADQPQAILRAFDFSDAHREPPNRSAATSPNVRPSPSRIALLPDSCCQRWITTSTYFGSSSIP